MWWLLHACGSEPPAAPAEVVATIGGEPILPNVVVLGGIGTDAVVAAVEAHGAEIRGCHRSSERGKVLVKIAIAADGAVKSVTVRSTSLRDAATETCLIEALGRVRFPALASGSTALVHYPFEFPR